MKGLTFSLSCLLLFACPTFAQKVGDTVVVIADKSAELRRGEVVGTVSRGRRLHVDEVNGEWLWVNWRGTRGWINRRDVIQFDKALDFFTAAIRRNPTAKDYNRRAGIWRVKGEYDIAISDYNEAIRLDPRVDSYYNNRAIAWKKKGEYDKALRDYGEAIRLDPTSRTVYKNRGDLWHARRNYTKAISDYNEAIRLSPKYAPLYLSRGRAWDRKREYEKAVSDFTEAIRLDPVNWLYYFNRGHSWYRNGDYGNAISDYNDTLRLKPDYSYAHSARGSARAKTGDYTQAISDFDRAIRLNPKYPFTFNALAWLQATCPVDRFRDGVKAVENGRRACQLTIWKNYDCLNTLAAAYAEDGKFPEAVKWQQKAIQLASTKKKDDYRSRLSLYESGQPYRENPG